MLIMQFLWKYIDDLMGKGIETSIILELLLYVSASLIPLALPLAILLSSIMTIGNLAENNELTALKASGMSLFKILKPLSFIVIFISVSTFYFANYVIPVANLKWHSLIYDIQDTKVATLIKPGTYSRELDGYAIKVKSGSENRFNDITIHDYTNAGITKTVKAKSGDLFKSENGKYLFFRLKNGRISEELNTQAPVFNQNGMLSKAPGDYRPSRRTRFDIATYKLELTGFQLDRSDQELFKDDFEMLNVFQINSAQDSMQKDYDKTLGMFTDGILTGHAYFQSLRFATDTNSILLRKSKDSVANKLKKKILLSDLTTIEKIEAMNDAVSRIRRKNEELGNHQKVIEMVNSRWDMFSIEFHRKFALTATILVLFFIGAPLGAIVKKGGFGAPVVIAALLFMVYFVLISIGDSLAGSGVLSPFWGMWLPSMILSPIAILLMISAANDLSIFDKKFWRLILKLGKYS